MPISTLDQYIGSVKQRIPIVKTASRASIAITPFSVFELAGNPGAGVLAGTNTANGVVPTDATAGCPIINFSTGDGYLTKVEVANSVASRIEVFDMLFKAGAYAFNANVTLSAQPSYSSRVPSGADFTGTEIWIEAVTAFTGLQSIAVTYTNQSGVAGRTTGTIATGVAPTVGRMLQLPLQSGDTGVQSINSVISTVSSAGTFNVLVLRPLFAARIGVANEVKTFDLLSTGMPVVYPTSALISVITPDSTATGLPNILLEIASA